MSIRAAGSIATWNEAAIDQAPEETHTGIGSEEGHRPVSGVVFHFFTGASYTCVCAWAALVGERMGRMVAAVQ
jgi:hypothetical protein